METRKLTIEVEITDDQEIRIPLLGISLYRNCNDLYQTLMVQVKAQRIKDDDVDEDNTYIPIEHFNFSTRTYNLLKGLKIDDLSQLVNRTEYDLTSRKFGPVCLKEVRIALKSLGLKLKYDI